MNNTNINQLAIVWNTIAAKNDLSEKKQFSARLRTSFASLSWFTNLGMRERKFGDFNKVCPDCFTNVSADYYVGKFITDDEAGAFINCFYPNLGAHVPTPTPTPAAPTPAAPPVPVAPAPAPVPAVQQPPATAYNQQDKSIDSKFSINLDLSSLVNDGVRSFIEGSGLLESIEKRVKEAAQKLVPTLVVLPDMTPVAKLEGRQHACFEEALFLAASEKQVYVAGPMGTGKTTMASQVAKALNRKFAFIPCTAGMSEAQLGGRLTADGKYISTAFVDIYENGGVFLFDEVDAADSNTLLFINSALANGHMSLPNRKDNPIAYRHDDCIIFCAANTWGKGSNEYAGRNQLDAAFLDRFSLSKMFVDYDTNLERDICKDCEDLYDTLTAIRKNVRQHRIKKGVSTRVFISAARQHALGKTRKQILDRLFVDWTDEERKKACENI